MAAIVQPHRLPHPSERRAPARPDLRLVVGGGPARSAPSPVAVVTLVVVALLVAAVGAVAVGRGALAGFAPEPVGATAAPAPAGAVPPADAEIVVVQPGDTLWSIARRLVPGGDVRPLVDRLAAANGGTVLQPGQQLVVPG
jgi:LysM repeat protein